MSFIDELTRRISAELRGNLEQAIRHAIEGYFIGEGRLGRGASPRTRRRGRPGLGGRKKRTAQALRERRDRVIIDAVSQLGEGTIEDVARITGLDKRGVGSSLYYLSRSGRLTRTRGGKYRVRKKKAA